MKTKFNNNLIFISDNSFKQNKDIAKNLQKYVKNIISKKNISMYWRGIIFIWNN
jgi:hypothetical protein